MQAMGPWAGRLPLGLPRRCLWPFKHSQEGPEPAVRRNYVLIAGYPTGRPSLSVQSNSFIEVRKLAEFFYSHASFTEIESQVQPLEDANYEKMVTVRRHINWGMRTV